jgi:hypothetical protein
MLVASRWVFNVFVLTVLTIALSALVFSPLLYSHHRLAGPVATSVLLLVGIWLSGSALILLALSVVPSPGANPGAPALSLADLFSPVSLIIASTYAGTLGALFVVSLWLGVTALVHTSLLVLRKIQRAV